MWWRALLVSLTFVSACYAPSVRDDGYACDPTAIYSCPDGFQCIDGLCDDGHGGRPPARDLAMTTPPDLAHTMPAPDDDMAHGQMPDDMAHGQTPDDMAQAAPDMAQSCEPRNAICRFDSDCCSDYCRASGTCR